MSEIRTKAEFMRLSRAGRLGNTLRAWDRMDGIDRNCVAVTVRSRKKDSPFFIPSVRLSDLRGQVQFLTQAGAMLADLYFQELPHAGTCADDYCQGCGRTMNGEVFRDEGYLYLIYGTSDALNLRHDLERNGKPAAGVGAVEAIRRIAGEETYEDLQAIWDEYPDSIIEFSAFSTRVGQQRRRAVIWEVRNY